MAIVGWPRELLLGLVQTLQFHGELTFTDLIVGERLQDGSTRTSQHFSQERLYLQVRSKSKLLADPNEPLSGVILVPLDRVPVVHGELVVEVMVAFPNRH